MIPRLQVGELDHCLRDIVGILIGDIFGEVGAEKETEEIKGKIKEAKSMRSFAGYLLPSTAWIRWSKASVPISSASPSEFDRSASKLQR